MSDESLFSGCFGCFMWLLLLGFFIAAAISTETYANPAGLLVVVGLSLLLVILASIQFFKGSFQWIKKWFKS